MANAGLGSWLGLGSPHKQRGQKLPTAYGSVQTDYKTNCRHGAIAYKVNGKNVVNVHRAGCQPRLKMFWQKLKMFHLLKEKCTHSGALWCFSPWTSRREEQLLRLEDSKIIEDNSSVISSELGNQSDSELPHNVGCTDYPGLSWEALKDLWKLGMGGPDHWHAYAQTTLPCTKPFYYKFNCAAQCHVNAFHLCCISVSHNTSS